MKIRFTAGFQEVGEMPDFGPHEIAREPRFRDANMAFAGLHAGPITRAFLAALPSAWLGGPFLLNSWAHLLQVGECARIPGMWHMDDVARPRRDGQPEHADPPYRAEHVAAIVGDASLPVFLQGDLELEDVPEFGGVVYERWNEEIESLSQRAGSGVTVLQVRPGRLLLHGWGSFHKAMPATKEGWRIYLRATRNTLCPVRNEINRPTPTYARAAGCWKHAPAR